MKFSKPKFPADQNAEFLNTLRSRVNDYFTSGNISKYGNLSLKIKTVLMFAMYFVPFFIMLSGTYTSPALFILLWVIMGLGVAGIGLNVMHDANHGVFSKNKKINRWLEYSMNLIGSNSAMWKIQHNVLHHSYTNIEGVDEDIESLPILLRFSPHQKKRWVHRFQFIYAWFFYGLMTVVRVFLSDFTKIFRYRNMGLIPTQKMFRKEVIILFTWKIVYFLYILVLPIVLLPDVSLGLIFLSFFIMHFVSGFILAIIFQTAHIMPEIEYPKANDKGQHDNSWVMHELLTTTNYAPRSRIFSWLIGGLNYQVEHHLFANICHVHYRKLSEIVKSTAEEYGMPYHSEKNFVTAVVSHGKMLYDLGRK